MEGTFVGGGSGKGQQGYYCIYIYTHYVQYMSVYNYVYVCVYIYIYCMYISGLVWQVGTDDGQHSLFCFLFASDSNHLTSLQRVFR